MFSKFDTKTVLTVCAIVLIALKFRNELLGLVAKVPVVGSLVA